MEREANPDEYDEDEHGQFLNGLGMMLSAMIANTSTYSIICLVHEEYQEE